MEYRRLLRGEALQHVLIAALVVAVRVLDLLRGVVGAGQDQLLDSDQTAPGELDVFVQQVLALSRRRCAHDVDAWMLRGVTQTTIDILYFPQHATQRSRA